MRFNYFLLFGFAGYISLAQNTTINRDNKVKEGANKVMLIPFEQKLYNSEIDYQINKETGLTGKQIKYKFRDGINDQLYKAFKNNKYGVLDLMEDTVKYKKETESIYQYLSYEYMKVPNQDNYKPPVKEKKEKTIVNGQINIETNSEARFMNAKIGNAKLVPLLYGKYKTNIFIFINQLDIKAAATPANGLTDGARKIIVHYTVYTYDAKEINSGIAEQEFPIDLNNPNKIIDKYFSKVAETICSRVNKALLPAK